MKTSIALLLVSSCTAIVLRAPGGDLHDKKGMDQETEFIDSGADASVIATSEAWEDIERKCDEEAVKNFHPSQWLISEWTKTAKTPKLKIVEQDAETDSDTDLANLPDQCRQEIMKKKTKTEACKDPWIKTKDCKHAYEVPNYRLGDLFFQYLCAPCNAQYTQHYFPGSIGDHYWKEKKSAQDYKALERILKSDAFKDYEKPDTDTLVLHVRGYDVMTVHSDQPQYRRPNDFYIKVAQKTASLGFKKAVIVTGDHWTTQVENLQNHGAQGELDKHATVTFANALKATSWRVNQIAQIFNKTGMEVSKRMNWNSDCDFVFMSNAKAFVPSGGTFDTIVSKMVRSLNGTIYTDKTK